jgi:hypothetical protein
MQKLKNLRRIKLQLNKRERKMLDEKLKQKPTKLHKRKRLP